MTIKTNNKTNTSKGIIGKKSKKVELTEKETMVAAFKSGFYYGAGSIIGGVAATIIINAGTNVIRTFKPTSTCKVDDSDYSSSHKN